MRRLSTRFINNKYIYRNMEGLVAQAISVGTVGEYRLKLTRNDSLNMEEMVAFLE